MYPTRRSIPARSPTDQRVRAIRAAGAGEALLQVAALQKGRHAALDDGTPESVLGRKPLVVDLLEGLEMLVQQPPQVGGLGTTGAVQRQGLDTRSDQGKKRTGSGMVYTSGSLPDVFMDGLAAKAAEEPCPHFTLSTRDLFPIASHFSTRRACRAIIITKTKSRQTDQPLRAIVLLVDNQQNGGKHQDAGGQGKALARLPGPAIARKLQNKPEDQGREARQKKQRRPSGDPAVRGYFKSKDNKADGSQKTDQKEPPPGNVRPVVELERLAGQPSGQDDQQKENQPAEQNWRSGMR